jgi:hypothetical protein
VNQLIIQWDMPLRLWNRKKPELKENDAVTHNSVFAAAHRLNAGQQPHVAVRHFRFSGSEKRRAVALA